MHEKRNFLMVLLLIGAGVWALVVWVLRGQEALWFPPGQRAASILLFASMAVWLVYALKFEDKVPDRMREVVGDVYYGVDGLDFMPTVRLHGSQAELCVYYQNNYENTAEVIVHLRPPDDSFIIRPGVRDVHFAFRAGGGDFGAIHQPIAVPDHLQGEVIEVHLAAVSHYPRSHGTRLRRHASMPCGSLPVDWGGSVFRTGVHEVSGEIDLQAPTALHLSMPKGVNAFATGAETWRQECIRQGTA